MSDETNDWGEVIGKSESRIHNSKRNIWKKTLVVLGYPHVIKIWENFTNGTPIHQQPTNAQLSLLQKSTPSI